MVKGLWDADRADGCPLHVGVLGPAPLLMQAGLTESLAGRPEPILFIHWSCVEMSETFGVDFYEYVYLGGYPGAAPLTHVQPRWSAYVKGALVEPVIKRDLLAMTGVDRPSLLKRLFGMGALYSGQILSCNKMFGQLQATGNTTTLTRCLRLLSDGGLLTGLWKAHGASVSAKASTPKLNVLNTDLIFAASGYPFEEARADRTFWGRMVESAVGAHLVNTTSAATEVSCWRHGNHWGGLRPPRGPGWVGIEVKTGRPALAPSGLIEFEKRFRPLRTLAVGTGGWPLDEFLSLPADHWFDPT